MNIVRRCTSSWATDGRAERLMRLRGARLAAVATRFYLAFFARMIVAGEVFHRLGFDWTMFWAQAMVLRTRGGAALYDVQAMNPFLHELSAYYRVRVGDNLAQPAPYPPWFAALVMPFTLPAPDQEHADAPRSLGIGRWCSVEMNCRANWLKSRRSSSA